MSSELQRRKEAYEKLNRKFGFLLTLPSNERETWRENEKYLQQYYNKDIEEDFVEEILHLNYILPSSTSEKLNAVQMLQLFRGKRMDNTFPNVDIALKMYVCYPVANTSGERSFSTLKRVKSYLRSTIAHAGKAP